MKQNITEKQLNELTPAGRLKLKAWLLKGMSKEAQMLGFDGATDFIDLNPKKKNSYFLSIGQMIEFLEEEFTVSIWRTGLIEQDWVVGHITEGEGADIYGRADELHDALWEAVKEILNTKP